jgi:anti-repressor protein
MNNIQIFQNEQFGKVRIAMNESDEPLFCLADVCNVIGIANARNVRSRLEEDDVHQMDTIDSLGRNQQVTFITESGLYDVVIRSDSEKAKPFRKWVTSEVLPSIRKHGAYMTSDTLEKALTSPDFLIQLATNLKEEKQKRIEAEQKAEVAEQKIQQDAPKVLFADAVSTSQRSCLVAELAKILQQNGVNIGQNRLFSWMRENGYLCQKGDYYNQPTQKAMKLGLFELKKTSITKPDGSVLVTTTTKVTGKGQIYFVEKFLGKDAA